MRSSVSVILSSPAPDTSMSHPDYEQTGHDHASLLILVKHIGSQLKPKHFVRMFERISRVCQERVEDSSGVAHAVTARYIKEYPVENNDWGDFQTHRRLLGLITVGKYDSQQELNELCRLHESLKVKYSSTIFDSRCVLLGYPDPPPYTPPSNFKAAEALWYEDPESCPGMEAQLCSFIHAVFWVLESKRLERGREKIDRVTLLQAPFEKKDFVGLDLESRTNRKRCVGRMTKHLGDLSLQSGLYAEALNYYTSACEVLRSVNDWLWLGGALEGLCATSVVVLFPNLGRGATLQRNASLPEGSPGKQRSSAISTNSLPNGIQPADVQQAQQEMNNLLTPEEVLKRYREAIIHYSKYQNAGIIETEASFKAARIAVEQSCTLQAASFLQNVIFINLPLSEQEKIQRFTSLSDLYCQIGFLRKASFCRRLAATRHVSTQNPQPNWAHCYQLMLQALRGHRLSLDPAELPADGVQGWPVLQVQLLQELVVAAKRAGLPALATRHMTFLLQSMWGHLSLVERRDLAMQLQALAAQCEGAPVPLVLDSGQVVPPANLTSVPSVRSFSLQNLPAPLRPQKLETQQEDSGPFLFTPIHFGSLERRSGASSKMDYQWVVGDTCEVSLELSNPLPFELKVSNMRLLTSGAVFESLPTSLALPPDSGPHPAKLCGIPKEVGELEVLGFSTHTLGVKSNIRLKHLPGFPHPQLQVDVVPALPQLTVTVSPPAGTLAPSSASPSCLGTTAHVVSSLSLALYAGQSVEVGIQLRSTGTEPVQLLEAAVSSPLDSQLQAQVFQFSAENLQTQLPLAPGSAASLTLYLHSASEFLAPGLMDAELGSLPASSLPMSSQPASFLSGPSSLPSRLSSPALPARRHDLTASFR
ncbi:Protein brunelleschi, partial [Gryllus bimaculatus]